MPESIFNSKTGRALHVSEDQNKWIQDRRKQWVVNEARLANMDVKAYLESNLALPQYIWKDWDRMAVEIHRERNVIYNNLVSRIGRNIPTGISVHEYRRLSDSEHRGVWSLDGNAFPNHDSATTDYLPTPVPFYVNSFGFSWLEGEALRAAGFAEDAMSGMQNCAYKTARDIDNALLMGVSDIVYAGTSLQGMLNHSQKKAVTKSVTNLNGATGAEWRSEFSRITTRIAENNVEDMGANVFFVNYYDWKFASDTDYSPEYESKSIAMRVQELMGVDVVVPTKNANIPANTVVAITADRQNAEILSRLPMVTLPKMRMHAHDRHEFQVWASCAFELKPDITNQCGLVHYS